MTVFNCHSEPLLSSLVITVDANYGFNWILAGHTCSLAVFRAEGGKRKGRRTKKVSLTDGQIMAAVSHGSSSGGWWWWSCEKTIVISDKLNSIRVVNWCRKEIFSVYGMEIKTDQSSPWHRFSCLYLTCTNSKLTLQVMNELQHIQVLQGPHYNISCATITAQFSMSDWLLFAADASETSPSQSTTRLSSRVSVTVTACRAAASNQRSHYSGRRLVVFLEHWEDV